VNTLRVVLLGADRSIDELAGVARVRARSAHAREALALSAARAGAALGPLQKGEHDAPVPTNGWHWSISHACGLSAGVVSRGPVGVDVEAITPRRQEIVQRVAVRDELDLLGGFSWETFFRLWTAKESVLKKAGCGILELSTCRLVAVASPGLLVLAHRGREHEVRLLVADGHVAAVAGEGPFEVEWTMVPHAEHVA
jgi:4'-phosphopantetheinyl transferase